MKIYGSNLGTKAVAILLALILWLFVIGQQTPAGTPEFTRTITNVPVETIGADRNFQYLISPSTVDIVIRGTQEFINSVVSREHRATVDVRNLGEGIHNLEVVTSIAGGVVQTIRPNYVTVIIDSINTMEFPITVETTGTLPEGLSILDINPNPNIVQLTGPSRELERITKVVATLNLNTINSSGEITTNIAPMDIHNRIVNSLQSNISNVIIEVALREETTLRDINLSHINLQEGLVANLSQNTIRARVPVSIDTGAVNPYVDLSELGEGTHTVTINSDVEGVIFEPTQIQVIIERE